MGPDMSIEAPWFVLRCLSQSEFKAEREVKALGFDALCPYGVGSRRIRGNPRKWRFPLFKGYLFASWPHWEEGWHQVTANTKAIYGYLGTIIPADVAYLQSIADGKYDPKEDPEPRIRVGDQVLVADPAPKDYLWTVVKMRDKEATVEPLNAKNKYKMRVPIAKLRRA